MNDSIEASALQRALERHARAVDVLSLDCFDTLLWRRSPEPTDLFCELAPPLSRHARSVAEHAARGRARVTTGSAEVTLAEIYRCALPNADEREIRERVEAELALEQRHCRAFGPAVHLIREAKRLGKTVVVVSDTYLTSEQLSALIAAVAGPDVAELIDRVFCSCDYRLSKSAGLLDRVLRELRVPAERVLHVGDHPRADLEAARAAGMGALQLVQGDASLLEQWRLEMLALLVAEPDLRRRAPPALPYRTVLAAESLDDPADRLGFATLGPVMYGFSRWVLDEARALARSGRPVKVCFLMRDGYLPMQVYRLLAAADDPCAEAAEISRFAAFAATFDGPDDIVSYLGLVGAGMHLEGMARQLLLTPRETQDVLRECGAEDDRIARFARRVLEKPLLDRIRERSIRERDRLCAYLRRRLDPKPGDLLLLVDLGYAGTVQNRIGALLERSLNVAVEGRYLLLRDVPLAAQAKKGYFGPDRIDARLLEAVNAYMGVFEQLCTADIGSVTGYSDQGEPRRKPVRFSATQVAARAAIQHGCLRFVRTSAAHAAADETARWQGALAALARLLLLPAREELALLRGFVHDVNLGAQDTVPLVDLGAAREDLRRLGLLYAKTSPRVFASGELRSLGLDLALLHLARSRFELDVRVADLRKEAIALPLMVARGHEVSVVQIDALPTHEGFYAACVPVGRCEYEVGVLFGRLFEWVQVESARIASVRQQFEAVRREEEIDVLPRAVHEGIRCERGGLLYCAAEHAFVYFAPPGPTVDNAVLRIVFRPLAWRTRAPVEQPAPAAQASA